MIAGKSPHLRTNLTDEVIRGLAMDRCSQKAAVQNLIVAAILTFATVVALIPLARGLS
jgi:hypothetical protein